MEIVTGKRGFPHVSSYEMQTFQRGLVSDGDVLLDVGDKLNYTIVDNNTIRILSGAILMQGIYCIIPYGTYDEMYIDSIEPGKVRKDVIYAQYNRDLETGMEEVIMDVKKGTEVNTGETPVQPSFPSPVTPLWEGGSFAYVKLYEVTVTYNAISVAEILDRSRVLLTPLQSVGQSVGDPVNLNTTDKSNIVSAVNEVNGKANANAVNIVTMLEDISGLQGAMGTANNNITALQGRMTTAEGDIDTLEGAVFSERKVYTERYATNITNNGRLILNVISDWQQDTAEVIVRFVKRSTGGYTDVVLSLMQNSYYNNCKILHNDGIQISKIYKGNNNLIFDFELVSPAQNAYDVYVTAPRWINGGYWSQSLMEGTELTKDVFDYARADYVNEKVGNLNNLQTTAKSNVVAAINEVNGRIVESDYVITEYSVPYVSGSNAIFMIRSNDVSVVGDEEYLLNVEVVDANGNAVEMLFITTDDSVVNNKVVINQRAQTSNFEAIPISKIEDATSFVSGNNAVLWVTLGGTPDVTVRLTHHKSKTYTVVASPAMPSGTGRTINFVNGNTELYSAENGNIVNYVSTKDSQVAIVSTSDATFDVVIINEGGQNPDIRMFTLQGDVNINGNYVGKTSLSGIGDGTITGAVAFSENDGEEVSGEVITVTDAIDANAVDMSVDIEPVQDLHGYDKPWVGGAGKNKLDLTVITPAKTENGVTFTVNSDGTFVVNGTTTSMSQIIFSLPTSVTNTFGGMILNGNVANSGIDSFLELSRSPFSTYGHDYGDGVIISSNISSAAYNVNLIYRIQSGVTLNNVVVKPMVRLATESDPTFEPYSNICPISAVTETGGEPQIEIHRVGVNQWDEEWELGALNNNTGADYPSNNSIRSKGYIKVQPETTYYCKIPTGTVGIYYYNKDKTYKGYTSTTTGIANTTFTTIEDAEYIRLEMKSTYGTTYNHDISINYPSTDHDYHAYQGTNYIIKTGSNIYGGTLDATTGKLVVDRAEVDLGDLTWSYDSTNSRFSADIAEKVKPTGSRVEYIPCSCYQAITDGRSVSNVPDGSIYSAANSLKVYVHDSRFSDATAFKTAVTGQTLVYELATPQEIQLTPTQQIKMLKGTNTVSSNAQNINLTYLKDNAVGKAVSIVENEIEPQIEEIHNEINTKLNADSIAPVENGATASTSYAVGSYIVRNNSLYKVISAISQGASFTNNNIQRTTVMAEILSRL